MTNQKSTLTLLATLTTSLGLSALMTTASLLPSSQVQARPLATPKTTISPADIYSYPASTPATKIKLKESTTIDPRALEPIPAAATSLPSISDLSINLDGAYYHASGNQLIAWNEQNRGPHPFECVEFAYGRSIEKGLFQNNQGIATVLNGDAHTWDDRIASSNYRSQLQTQVRANSIVVWEANQNFSWKEGNGTYTYNTDPVAGHVAFVEKVNPDGSFVISEGNHQAQPIIKQINAGTPPATAAKFIYL
jgi:surface antigen